MTFVGHSLAGAAVAVLVAPQGWGRARRVSLVGAYAFLANLPDLPLPFWGHARYEVSHSVFVNLGLLSAISAVLLLAVRRRLRTLRWVLFGAWAAWLGHLLLDTLYSHGCGLAVFWPFGDGRVAMPLPWFETLREPLPHLDGHALRVFAVELVAYGLVLALALGARAVWRWRKGGREDLPPGAVIV